MTAPTQSIEPAGMTPAKAAALRAPFADSAIGYKPTVWCRACRESRTKACDNHQKNRCTKCRQNVTTAHTDLAFVGHAEVTDRLLQVDPTWFWEPLAYTPDGLPAIDRETGGLWIRLTVCGVTRIGYGDAEGKNGPSAIKELVGDAVRVTAMRFGVGLDLWGASGKGEAQAQAAADHASDTAPEQPQQTPPTEQAPQRPRAVKGTGEQRPAKSERPAEGQDKAALAAGKLLDSADVKALERCAARVEELGLSEADASTALTGMDRDTLGLDENDKVTLDDLVALLRSYHHRHSAGPRVETAA